MSNALCFYPNGNPSLEDDIPCGVGSAVGCCPLNWACLANGLCYLQNENYYGRYTCTDQSWGPGCPNICTYNDTAKGNEAVLECTTDSYCCDTNRPELSGGTDCCNASPSRFSIDGNAEVPSTSDSVAASSTYSPVQPVPISAPTTSTSAQTSAIASVAAPSLTCNSNLEQTSCGSTCCASDQYCAFAGQCSATSVTTESSSGTSTPTVESIASAATRSPSSYTPTATRPTSMATSESVSLAPVSPVTSSSITSPSTPSTSKSSAASATKSVDGTPSAAPSPSVTSTTGFKAGFSVGVVVTLAILLLALYCWRRHRRRRQPGPTISGNASFSTVAPIPTGLADPPNPNPYDRRVQSDPSLSIQPDHDTGDHNSQPNLRLAPALNPYSRPASAAALSNQAHLQSSSPAPSYRTEDPERQGRGSRSRLSLIGR